MTADLPSQPETDARLAAARHAVLRRVRRRRHARTGAVIGAALLVAGSGVGATVVVQRMSQQEAASSVVCYAHDDLGSLSGTVAMASASPSPGMAATAPEPADKREMCALRWRMGLAVEAAGGRPEVDSYTGTGDYAVPPLAFCLLRTGQTGGFPIEAPSTTAVQVCDRLGLPVDGSVPAA